MITSHRNTFQSFSLIISVKKTVTLSQGTQDLCEILLDNNEFKSVQKFTYLAFPISANLSFDMRLVVELARQQPPLESL